MHNYTVSVTRNCDADWVYYPFSFEATIRLPADEVWAQWTETIVDYTQSWLWPTKFSRPVVNRNPPAVGAQLELGYDVPNPHDPNKAPKKASYQFDIIEWDDAARIFAYLATDEHPFLKGGGRLEVSVIDAGSCRFHWKGEYKHLNDHKGKEAQGDVFAFFLCTFFTTMAQNIKTKVGFDPD